MGFDGSANVQREDIFLFSGLNTYISKLPLHNEIKKDKCNRLNDPTYYQFARKVEPVNITYDDSNEIGRINYEKEISHFLEKNVNLIYNNFKESEKTIFKTNFIPGIIICGEYRGLSKPLFQKT